MVLPWGLELLVDNVGMSFEWIVLLILIMGAVIVASKNFQIAMIVLMVTSGAVFVWWYNVGLNWTYPLATFFLALLVMTFSLWTVNKTSATGGFQ